MMVNIHQDNWGIQITLHETDGEPRSFDMSDMSSLIEIKDAIDIFLSGVNDES